MKGRSGGFVAGYDNYVSDSYIYKIKPLEPTTVKLALLSVYDKTGLVDFARQLKAGGYDLVSTGGTARDLQGGGLDVQQVSDLTGSPEILDGRVKTLHPKVHAGILARRDNKSHMAQLADDETGTIDIVVGNLYPFVETVSRPDVTLDDALENIDIGGPTMIRAAAKNFRDVLVVVDPADYEWIGERIAEGTEVTLQERKELARKAFQHVALYDTAISRYLSGQETNTSWSEFTLGFNRVQDLRYGENPHQQATLYSTVLSTGGIVDAKRLHGLEMSFTNILDADAAWRVVSDFSENAVAIIKHTNPCGLAIHPDQVVAYQRAFEGDSLSAYGGIVGFNRTVTVATAEAMRGVLYDQIIAPGFEPEALKILKRRRRTRILEVTLAQGPTERLDVRTVSGGVLVQTADTLEEDPKAWNIATKRAPTDEELRDLAFAWRACKHIKSNTIVLAKDNTLIGMGAGQPNRVVSVHLALRIAGDKAKGSVLASDAFFPFPDSIEMAAESGITAIAQPGGSIRDDDSIEAANRLGLAMALTGTRHFRH
ncbi:MAG: bifunctional phosphoribosylaminoimidazolecarboxamide formyltransferase/IMP cyclohydrolase [Chloroflexi bacterium]|nr:bifunctional phosphoribosylaminoimidazolecarboxamide formyltransferase/IMP cyclohydrolase [Chloroflexota bacterium]